MSAVAAPASPATAGPGAAHASAAAAAALLLRSGASCPRCALGLLGRRPPPGAGAGAGATLGPGVGARTGGDEVDLAEALEAEAGGSAAPGAETAEKSAALCWNAADAVCGACLGLLQPDRWEGWGWPARLKGALGGTGGAGGVQARLDLALPPALALRQAALARWARGRGVLGARSPDMAELHAEVGRHLAAAVPGLHFLAVGTSEASAPVVLLAEAKHRGTRTEWLPMAPPTPAGRRGRRRRGGKGPPGDPTIAPPAQRIAEAARLWASVCKQLRALDRGTMSPPDGWTGWPEPLSDAWRVAEPAWLVVQPASPPVFIAGRYKKLERSLSQTPWLSYGANADPRGGGDGDGGGPEGGPAALEEKTGQVVEAKVGPVESVECALVRALCPVVRGSGLTMHSAGREDRGVRMLGRGRPFVVEVRTPLLPLVSGAALSAAAQAAEALGVSLDGLRLVDGKRAIAALAEGAAEKQKLYTAVVWSSRALTAADVGRAAAAQNLVLKQNTPVRVLHRRSPMVRERVIHWLELEPVPGNPHYAVLRLGAQAGTYIKEFVHGDFGRTRPNLGEFLGGACRTDILQLDVTDILMDFDPPPPPAASAREGSGPTCSPTGGE